MISQVCQQCHAVGRVKYVTFCDGCGLEIEGELSINIDGVLPLDVEGAGHFGAESKQGHFHQKCTPEFEVMVSATSARCGLCGVITKPGEIGSLPPLDRLRHDLKLHGYKVPVSKGPVNEE